MLTQLIGNLALIIVPEAAAFKVGEAGEAVELGSKAGSATELAEDMPKIEEGIDAAKETEEIEGTGEALNGAEKAAEEIENGTKITQGAGEANATIDYVKLSEELGKNIEADGYEVVSTETAEQANADWGDVGFDLPPIAQNTTVYNVKAGNFSYSRVYLDGYNYPKSRFILRTEDIEGLSPQEIAQKYALPKKAWGTLGGDVQYAIKDSALKDDWFSNIRDLK